MLKISAKSEQLSPLGLKGLSENCNKILILWKFGYVQYVTIRKDMDVQLS
jgi:hypothetical protein